MTGDTGNQARAGDCPVCGTANEATARFCLECGTRLADEPPVPIAAPPSDPWLVPTGHRDDPAGPPPLAPAWAASTAHPRPSAVPPPVAAERRPDDTWLASAAPGRIVLLGLLLLVGAVLLVGVRRIDKTGTVMVVGFCLGPIGFLVCLVGLVRAVSRPRR